MKWSILGIYIIYKSERKKKASHLIFYSSISSEAKCFMPGQVSQKHKSIIQPIAASITSPPTMVKRCDFTSKQEEKAWTHPGNVFKKLIYVSCWVLHLQFKQNPTWLPHRVWFIRYQGVARSYVIKTVINWKRKVPPEFWEAVNFISITALLLVLLLTFIFLCFLRKQYVCPHLFFHVLKYVWMATSSGEGHEGCYLFQFF